MEKKTDEFYVGYLEETPFAIKKTIKRFVLFSIIAFIAIAAVFALTQNKLKNSAFELTTATKIMGVYHESPYPMLKIQTAENTFKSVVLVGFGKSGANPFLKNIKDTEKELEGKVLQIEGNLIYYNGKTVLQITDDQKVSLVKNVANPGIPPIKTIEKDITLKGEIVDPKCYFGVMKPGKGKIHRSCAVLCIAGGIPPVLATSDANNISEYYLITDEKGNAIHKDILPYIGKPSLLKGTVVQMEDWYQLQINVQDIQELDEQSRVY